MLNRRQFGVSFFGKGVTGLMLVSAFTLLTTPVSAQVYRFNPEHRRPIEATLHDLEEVGSRNAYTGHERERYDNAIHHLSEFGERLHEGGVFDKDKLDQAIGDIQSVLDHNKLHPRGRQILTSDVMQLRRLRQHYDDMKYRYR